jgi:hypothetical protein
MIAPLVVVTLVALGTPDLRSLAVDGAQAPVRVAQAAPSTKPTLAVLPLKATGLQLNEAQRLDLALRTRFELSGRFTVQDAASTTKLLEAAQGLGLDCDVNALACARDIGQIADVDMVILGAAVVIDEGTEEARVGLDLRLVDVRQGTEIRRVSGLIPRAPTDMLPGANQEIAHLLDDTAPLAKAVLKVAPDGARILLNGIDRGVSPLAAPLDGLAPGSHHLRIEREGHLPHVTRFTLAPLEAADIDVVLVANPVEVVEREISIVEQAIPWSVAGGGAVTALAGLAMLGAGLIPLVQHEQAKDRLDDVAQDNAGYAEHVESVYAEQSAHAQSWNTWGRLLTGVGGTAMVVGALVAGAGVAWGITLVTLTFAGEETPPTAPSGDLTRAAE